MTEVAVRAVRALARVVPRGFVTDPDSELDHALAFLGIDATASEFTRAGYAALLLSAPLCFAVWALAVSGPSAVGAAVALAVGLGTTLAVHRAPVVLAALERTRTLGDATDLVGRLALRMRVEPSIERAVAFAAHAEDGPLAASLSDHARRAQGTAETGLRGFADEWDEWLPALGRSVELIRSSAAAPDDERDRTLDRATAAVLDGVNDEVADFVSEVRTPVMGIYAFGVLLPLSLVGVLPAAHAAGIHIPLAGFVAGYDVLLPAVLCWACVRLFARRPVAFPPPRVGHDHPDVPDSDWWAVGAGAVGGLAGYVAGTATVAPWAGPVAAVGAGVGSTLVARFHPVKTVRDDARAVESALDDALYLVGRRVSEGVAVETALSHASEEVSGATGDVLADAVGIQRRLRVGVRDAFFADYGALATLPSPRTRSAAALIALAAREGRPAGRAVVAMGEHLSRLRTVERDSRRELSSVTETLTNTAALFGPLVGGATVSLASRLGQSAGTRHLADSAPAVPISALGVAIGVYVLLLAALLTTLSTGLSRGLDRSLVGYRVGLSLLLATPTFLAGAVGTGLVL